MLHGFFYAEVCRVIIDYAQLSFFVCLCTLEEKKKNFNKYIYVYKKGKFAIYDSHTTHHAARRSRAGNPSKVPLVCEGTPDEKKSFTDALASHNRGSFEGFQRVKPFG
jgi:hypothetical protein